METKCESCGSRFISKLDEVYCEKCAFDYETLQDRLDLNSIVSRRGYKWLEEYLETRKVSCHYCGKRSEVTIMADKKINEGGEFKEESGLNYNIAKVCQECVTKI